MTDGELLTLIYGLVMGVAVVAMAWGFVHEHHDCEKAALDRWWADEQATRRDSYGMLREYLTGRVDTADPGTVWVGPNEPPQTVRSVGPATRFAANRMAEAFDYNPGPLRLEDPDDEEYKEDEG